MAHDVLGLLVLSPSLPLPARGVRAARVSDLLRVLAVADHDLWRHPVLVAAALALTHKVSRVIVAAGPDALADAAAIALLDPPPMAFDGPVPAPPPPWLFRDIPTFAAATPGPPLDPSWRRHGLHLVPGRAEVLLPHHPRKVAVSAAVLAATLFATGRPTLLPTVEFTPPHEPADELTELGYAVLSLRGPSRRVGRGPGFPSAPSAPGAPPPTSAPRPPPDLPPELWPLYASLTALCERSSHRLAPLEAGMRTLDREANKLMQQEVALGRIKGYALAITPTGDDLTDLAIEVVVTLPRRVGQVILRLSPTPERRAP